MQTSPENNTQIFFMTVQSSSITNTERNTMLEFIPLIALTPTKARDVSLFFLRIQ